MSKKQIGTHSGSFHVDEALACFMLRLTNDYKDAEIVRTRDEKVMETLPILVDVGAQYIPEKGRFDHHQRGFFQVFSDKYKTKLSSAGLIYKHYGREVITNLTGCKEEEVSLIHDKVYQSFIEALDGIDNGIPQYPTTIKPNYSMNTDLSSRVGRLNPSWNEEGEVDIQARFHQAMEMAGKEFVDAVMFVAKSWLPARSIVKAALDERGKYSKTGEIVVFHNYTIWKRHLMELEEELKVEPLVKYVLYQDTSNQWRVQCVPEAEESFNSRLPLPEEWRGVRDAELSKISGIEGCVFVHASGFIGGNQTYEGALKMAEVALEMGAQSGTKKQKTETSA